MSESIAAGLVLAAAVYLGLGVLFVVPFLAVGVARIDPAARESGWGFRLMIVPGVIALWPILARRWLAGSGPPQERNAHRDAARDADRATARQTATDAGRKSR